MWVISAYTTNAKEPSPPPVSLHHKIKDRFLYIRYPPQTKTNIQSLKNIVKSIHLSKTYKYRFLYIGYLPRIKEQPYIRKIKYKKITEKEDFIGVLK